MCQILFWEWEIVANKINSHLHDVYLQVQKDNQKSRFVRWQVLLGSEIIFYLESEILFYLGSQGRILSS